MSLGQTQIGATGERYDSQPYQGVPQTIKDMRALVHMALQKEHDPALRQLVESIIAQVTPKDYLSEIAACYYYVTKNVRYTRDPLHVERVQHPFYTLVPTPNDRADGRRGRQADCDCAATTLAAMIMVIGNAAEFVTISTDASRGFHHVFVAAPIHGRRIVLDPVPGPHVADMLRHVQRYQAWPIEPVRRPGVAGWVAAAAPMLGALPAIVWPPPVSGWTAASTPMLGLRA